jgi:hypothetical protein
MSFIKAVEEMNAEQMKAFAPSNLAAEHDPLAAAAAAAKAEHEQLAAANESHGKLLLAVAEGHRRAAAALKVPYQAPPVVAAPDLAEGVAAKATVTDASSPPPSPPPLPSPSLGLDQELRFEDPSVKSLLRDIFNLPAYTEQLFSFPVHDPYVRSTYFGRPGILLPGNPGEHGLPLRGSKTGMGYNPVFELPSSNEPEGVGYRLNQAIDLYKDAYCYDRHHALVPVLAHPEVECKRRVEAWVTAKQTQRPWPAPPGPFRG